MQKNIQETSMFLRATSVKTLTVIKAIQSKVILMNWNGWKNYLFYQVL